MFALSVIAQQSRLAPATIYLYISIYRPAARQCARADEVICRNSCFLKPAAPEPILEKSSRSRLRNIWRYKQETRHSSSQFTSARYGRIRHVCLAVCRLRCRCWHAFEETPAQRHFLTTRHVCLAELYTASQVKYSRQMAALL